MDVQNTAREEDNDKIAHVESGLPSQSASSKLLISLFVVVVVTMCVCTFSYIPSISGHLDGGQITDLQQSANIPAWKIKQDRLRAQFRKASADKSRHRHKSVSRSSSDSDHDANSPEWLAVQEQLRLKSHLVPDGIIDSKAPSFAPTPVPSKALMPLPDKIFESPIEYVENYPKPIYCPFKYNKDDPILIPAGCVFFANHDIGWKEFESSRALMMCTQANHGATLISEKQFKEHHLVTDKRGSLSIVKPGAGATATIYKGPTFNGPHVEFSKNHQHPLVHYSFPQNGHYEDNPANDNVHSVTITSNVDRMPASCDIILHDLMYCPFTYVRGESKATPYGCTLFTRDDIGYVENEESPAVYVCATEAASPVRVSSNDFILHKLVRDGESSISIIKPGAGTSVQFFTHGDFTGLDGTFSKMKADLQKEKFWPHTLSHYKFGGRYGRPGHSEDANDNVKSAIVTSVANKIPSTCKDLFSHRGL